MIKTATRKAIALKFVKKDAAHRVSRGTVKQLQKILGLSDEESVVQYALAALRDSLLPRYEPDDGAVSDEVLESIRTAVDQNISGGESLF